MGRNICVFSDGTGLGGSWDLEAKSDGEPRPEDTNVYRLYWATKSVDPALQVSFYDPGLGSPRDGRDYGWLKWGRDLVSKATGLGISDNIKDCYDFLIRETREDDRILLFGFSRGAYTVRSLGGLLGLCGVPRKNSAGRELAADADARRAAVEWAVEKVYKHYAKRNDEAAKNAAKEEREKSGKIFREEFKSMEKYPRFIGVWDTVRALGIPGSSGLVGWRHAFHDAGLNAKVPRARQALAIDEDRDIFEPVLWDERGEALGSDRIVQRWFPGAHSDVGGGYADRRLADATLHWMIDEARAMEGPLLLEEKRLPPRDSQVEALGTQHSQRRGLGKLWVPGVRTLENRDVLHEPHVRTRFLAPRVPHAVGGERPYDPPGAAKHGKALEWRAARQPG